MTLTEFAMVEELASLVKDNLPCKHLVLSMEEMLVNFLQDDTRLDEELELEPMDPYNRLLLHRLAEIFGFYHQSTGEGDNRHLILKRCQESSIPSILVGDLLCEYDENETPTSSQLLSRIQEGSPVIPELKPVRPITRISLEQREAAYLAARERIFSVDKDDMKRLGREKPQHNPVVARRMIAHALGKKVGQSDQTVSLRKSTGYGELADDRNIQDKEVVSKKIPEIRPKASRSSASVNLQGRPNVADRNGSGLLGAERKDPQNVATKTFTKAGNSGGRKHSTTVHKDNMKEENIGAAKRMFAHALGIHSTRGNIISKSNELKQANY